ncbi:MAG: thioredoxin family protein [Sarcina sp.]
MNNSLKMEDLLHGNTYEDIKVKADDNQLAMIKEQAKVCSYDAYKVEELKKIDKKINIAVFIENRCADAQTMVPILKKIVEVNENIKPNFFETDKHEKFLVKKVGEKKIPTMLFLTDENEISSVYKEFPIKVRALIEANLDNREFIVKEEFRKGKYNSEVEKDIVDSILNI